MRLIQEQFNSTEPVAFSEYSGIQSELVNNEQTVDEFVDSLLIKNDEFYSNQPYFVHDKQDTKLYSDFQIYNANTDIPKVRLGHFSFYFLLILFLFFVWMMNSRKRHLKPIFTL